MKNNCQKKQNKQTTTKKNESKSKSSKVIYLVLSQSIFITYKLVIHAHVCTIFNYILLVVNINILILSILLC